MNAASLTRQRLEPFLQRAATVKGVDAIHLITDVLSEPGVYVFAELYEAPNVIEASTLPNVAPYYKLLEVFQYNTYEDYLAIHDQLPSLSEEQQTKLKHLSILSLAKDCRSLPYDVLQQCLAIPTVRELEDLIIEAFYHGILVGKLDQRQSQLQVDFAMGRDLQEKQRKDTLRVLTSWSGTTSSMLKVLDRKIDDLKKTVADNEKSRRDYDQKVEALRAEIAKKNTKETDQDASRVLEEYSGYRTSESWERGRAKKRGSKRYLVG